MISRETALPSPGLVCLPIELLLEIIKYLDIHDRFALGLTCQYLWIPVLRAIQNTEGKVSWVGKSLVCLNHHLGAGDLPRPLKRVSDAQSHHNSILDHESISLHALVQRDYDLIPANRGLHCWLLKQAYKDKWLPAATITRGFQQIILQNSGQVLRNLTKKEFVRGNALPFDVSLGHTVLIQILWSGEPFTRGYSGIDLFRSDWAGHCFDIVDAEIMRNAEWEGWRDATDVVASIIESIWIRYHTFRWRAEQWTLRIPAPGISWLPVVID